MTATLETSSLWEICAKLVALDTVSTNSNVAAAELLADWLDRPGWTVRLHRDFALGADKASVIAWAGPAEPDGLLLSGHMDIVPFAEQPGWTREPLALTRAGDRIFGRGVADMKGFLAQCVEVARSLDLTHLRKPVALIFTPDEEVGALGAERLLPHIPTLLGIPVPSRAILGEPSNRRVFTAHKGHVRVVLELHGRGGHSSRPDLGASAIAAAAEAMRAIDAFARQIEESATIEQRTLFPEHAGIACNFGTIRGGTADNMNPEKCVLTFGFRPRPGDQADALMDAVVQAAQQAVQQRYPGVTVHAIPGARTPAMSPPPDDHIAEAIRFVTGNTTFGGAPYATDGGQFERIGIRSFIWGPGEIEQAHKPDESLPVEAFVSMPAQIEKLVRCVCAS